MPGRTFTTSVPYRYGFNGKENDAETGNQDYGMRIYCGSLGRFLSIDPLAKTYAMFSTYQFAGNRPIVAIDLDGLEPMEHPYLLKPVGKVYTGVTNEGKVYEAYQVNSPTNGLSWVAKVSEKLAPQGGMEMKPIDHFLYHNPEGGWMYWQRGDEMSLRGKMINKIADGIGIGFYGIVAAGAAAPAVAEVTAIAAEGIAGEVSLFKHIPNSFAAPAKVFAANVGLQIAFNGKDADIYDAATATLNPWIAFLTNPVVNYKPGAGEVIPTIGVDAPEVMAKKFVVSAPFMLLGSTMQNINPSGANPTTDYLMNVLESSVDNSISEDRLKGKKK